MNLNISAKQRPWFHRLPKRNRPFTNIRNNLFLFDNTNDSRHLSRSYFRRRVTISLRRSSRPGPFQLEEREKRRNGERFRPTRHRSTTTPPGFKEMMSMIYSKCTYTKREEGLGSNPPDSPKWSKRRPKIEQLFVRKIRDGPSLQLRCSRLLCMRTMSFLHHWHSRLPRADFRRWVLQSRRDVSALVIICPIRACVCVMDGVLKYPWQNVDSRIFPFAIVTFFVVVAGSTCRWSLSSHDKY